ncbi:excalibur calcium-binding domain-containing protein [Nocardia sp. NPDC051321]|uniref:excalibur calcium-binding domain-containing protein n=1 Tax=Nocardia sp. NPDC051321 TaxID=3364323 RepID=UPI0037A803A7
MTYSVMRRVAPAIGAACLVVGAIALVPSTAAATSTAATVASPDDSWPTPDRDGKGDDQKKRSAKIYTDCDQVRAEGAGTIYRGDPSYNSFLDQDGNGIACDN